MGALDPSVYKELFMKKPSNLGELSASNLTKQKTIEDTVIAQITNEFLSLKQIIIDSVKSEVMSFLNDLKSELKTDQSQLLNQISDSNKALHERIDTLIDQEAISSHLDQLDTRLSQIEERITQIDEKAQTTLTSLTNQVDTNLGTYANHVDEEIASRIKSEKQDYERFLSEQQTWRSELITSINRQNQLPVILWVIFLSLLAISLGINISVLVEWRIWSTFMITSLLMILFILTCCGIYLAYQQLTRED